MAAGTDTPDAAMKQPASVPRSVLAFTAVLAAVALASAAVHLALFGTRAMSMAWVPVFGAVLCAAASFQIRFRYRDEIEALDLFEAVLAPVLFAYSGWIAVALVVAANVIAEVLRRNTPVKGAFNVAQWAAAAGVGALVYSSLRQGSTLDAHNVGALAVSLIVVLVINHLAFATVVALVQRHSLGSVLTGLREVIVPGWIIGGGLNLAFGFLF